MKVKAIKILGIGAIILGTAGFVFAQKHKHVEGHKGEPKQVKVTIVKDVNGNMTKSEEVITLKNREDMHKYLESKGINRDELEVYRRGGNHHGKQNCWVYDKSGKTSSAEVFVVKSEDIEIDSKDQKQEKVIVKTMVISEDDGQKPEQHEVRIKKEIDDEGNVTIQKWVDGEEVDPGSKQEMPRFKMMEKDGEMTIEVDDENGEAKVIKIKKEIGDDGQVIVMKSVNGSDFEKVEGKGAHHMRMRTRHHHAPMGFAARTSDGKTMVFVTPVDSKLEEAKVKKNTNEPSLIVDDLNFYPNPTQGNFKISFKTEQEGEITVSIKDLQGKQIFSERYNAEGELFEKEISLKENTESGMYLVEISQNGKTYTQKLLVK